MTARRVTKNYPVAAVKSADPTSGEFSAIVAVFGNVDYQGDRLASSAFDASLARWKASGDPIPVVWSHQWHDLDAYLGHADPANIEPLQPGDARLPEAIRDLGGLLVAGTIDVEEPAGRKAAKLLSRRVVREFSFAYDVLDEKKAGDGANDLLEVDLIEAGPTLKGANPLTQLLEAKADEVARVLGVERSELARLASLEPAASEPARPAKAYVQLPGSVERLLEGIYLEVRAWGRDQLGENLYDAFPDATYGDHVIAYLEAWDDPAGGGSYFRIPYTVEDDLISLGEAEPVDLEVEIRPRLVAASRPAAGKVGARNSATDLSRIQGIHDLTAELGATCTDPDGATGDDDGDTDPAEPDGSASRRSSPPAVLVATVEAELLDL